MNRSRLNLATVIVLAAGLLGCAPLTVDGRYSYGSQTDFSKFRTFAFADLTDDVFSTPESTSRFRTEMVSALTAKGFSENPDNPDFQIYTGDVRTYVEVYMHAGHIEIPKAMIRVNFERPEGGLNIYEASAFAYYEHEWSQDEKNAVVDAAVIVIVAEFPPNPE
jgi:hypothetical protein